MRKHFRDCIQLCRDAGLNVTGIEHRGRHWAVCTETGGKIFMPSTPSDRRWRANARAVARRISHAPH